VGGTDTIALVTDVRVHTDKDFVVHPSCGLVPGMTRQAVCTQKNLHPWAKDLTYLAGANQHATVMCNI
jgi:hypothetical protein